MSKQGDLAKNTLIIAFGKISTQFVAFALLPLYTYFLSPAEYGLVDLAVTYLVLLVPALTLQTEMASFRFLVDARADAAKRVAVVSNIFYITVPIIVLAAIVFAVVSAVLHFAYFEELLLAGLSLFAVNFLLQIARGLGENKQFSIASLIVGLTTAITAVLFIAVLGWRIEGMLLSLAVANFMGALYLLLRLKVYRYFKLSARDSALQREILGYSLPLVPNGAAWWVINISDRTIVTVILGAAANGIYSVASKYGAILSSAFSIFNMSWTESASLHINAPDRDAFFSKVYNTSVRLFGALGLCLIAVIPFIFPLLVNDAFREAYLYIPILVVGAFFNAIVALYSAIYIAKKQTKQVMNTSLVAAGLNIALTIGLMPFFGLYAAAFATAAAFLAMAIYRHHDSKKYVTIRYEKKILVIFVGLYVVVAGLYYLQTPLAAIAGLAIAGMSAGLLNRHTLRAMTTKSLGFLARR